MKKCFFEGTPQEPQRSDVKPKSMENLQVILWCAFSVQGLSCDAHFTTLFTVCFLAFTPCVHIPERCCSSKPIILFS